jgi:hypothetical protein
MDREDIIKLAREAGCIGPDEGGDPNGLWEPHGHENVTELMMKFAALVAAAEREAFVQIIEEYQIPVGNSPAGELACEWTYDALKEIRDDIRARGNT